MLNTERLIASEKIDRQTFRRVMARLKTFGWTPLSYSTEAFFASAAGLSEDMVVANSFRFMDLQRVGEAELDTDVFFRDDGFYYLISYPREDDAFVQLTLVTQEADTAQSRLNDFAKVFVDAVRAEVDGRRFRHMSFNWSSTGGERQRLEELRARLAEDGSDVRFQSPAIADEEVAAVEILSHANAREMMKDLSRAGFAREQDVLSRRGRKEEGLRALLDELSSNQLVTVEFLLQCRNTNSPITRVSDTAQLEMEGVGELRCATCNRRFADELMSPGYTVSDLGRRLVQSSHWMTVWLTLQLVELGIPLSSIMWNMEEAGDEIDLVMEFLGELWIFELKDREFGPGDAHPFNYRRVRYQANKAIIVTTTKVSTDAKRVFGDLDREAADSLRLGSRRTLRRAGSNITKYIEGLANAKPELERELLASAQEYAFNSVRTISSRIGFDLRKILTAKWR